ncbi:phosphoesterase family-domain-containing protein [Mycena leptocephala]|nr:phosphoesterase family-domain-containing protein [Mycena leptocephala]
MAPTTLLSAVLLAVSVRFVSAATAQVFAPPSKGPLVQTANYTSFSNHTLNDKKVVKGKVFNRVIQVWLENTDFETASSTPIFESLAEQGLLLTNYNSVTHPSEPNYVAAVGGDFFGMHDDNMYHIPSNISTVVDLLEDKGVSWATYQENMAADSFYGIGFAAPNYASPESGPYPYYVRKHNPAVIYDAISQDSARAARIRTFNDFANDVVNGTLPQWLFITPNMANDAHDTTIDFAASFLEYWLLPLLTDPRVNGEDTLIIVTFDENHTFTVQNRVFTVVLGTALPLKLRGTTDDTFYTHYSLLSTVQNNWGLKSLGRQDTNATVSNVLSFVAEKTGHKNVNVPANQIPQLNLTGVASGALTSANFVPFAAPNLKAHGAGSGGVLTRPGLNEKLTPEKLPPPVNMLLLNKTTPWQMSPETVDGKHIIPCADALCA